MYWDVVEVFPVADRELAVRFEDGAQGVVRVEESFCTGVFAPLLDSKLFNTARIEHGVVVWPNGLDLAPDTMYRKIKNSSDQRYHLR